MDKTKKKHQLRKTRQNRIRVKVSGTSERPRLNVYRSNTRLYAQLVDDVAHKTIISASTSEKNIEAAKKLGTTIAEKAKEKGVKAVVFDRGGFAYHGGIKAIADAAREGGLTF